MAHARRYFGIAVLSAAFVGCDGGKAMPTSPSAGMPPTAPAPSPPPTPDAPARGEISLISTSVPPGTILTVRECPPDEFGIIRLCTEDLRMTFAVLLDRDVTGALVQVVLANDSQGCAFALSAPATLIAGTRAEITASVVNLFLANDIEPIGSFTPCPLPASVTRMVVTLRTRTSYVLTQDFFHRYTLAR
jgi:hypothetical protein